MVKNRLCDYIKYRKQFNGLWPKYLCTCCANSTCGWQLFWVTTRFLPHKPWFHKMEQRWSSLYKLLWEESKTNLILRACAWLQRYSTNKCFLSINLMKHWYMRELYLPKNCAYVLRSKTNQIGDHTGAAMFIILNTTHTSHWFFFFSHVSACMWISIHQPTDQQQTSFAILRTETSWPRNSRNMFGRQMQSHTFLALEALHPNAPVASWESWAMARVSRRYP